MSATHTTNLEIASAPALGSDSHRISLPFFLALVFTVGAICVDQFFAPALYSSSPLWAAGFCLLLVWQRGLRGTRLSFRFPQPSFSAWRLLPFAAAHFALLILAKSLDPALRGTVGNFSAAGWTLALLKLSVLAPTALLFSLSEWRQLILCYKTELLAGIVVLFTFFPNRLILTCWPWYGRVLGHFVFFLTRAFVPSLSYHPALFPMLSGPQLEVTILSTCSGINGVALFDYLFALVVFLDWNSLKKRAALLAYFGGIAAILFANALRISFFVVAGNHGFSDWIARFHLAAGWVFFTAASLAYLLVSYRYFLFSKRPVSIPAN